MERFRELSERLPGPVRWCAGPQEPLDGAVRFGNLYDLACWLASARVYIGNDSGITHLAAAAGVPVVAVFGPTDPAMWAPRGERVQVLRGALGEIAVDQVLDAVAEALVASQSRRLRKRSELSVRITTPKTASATICGHSTSTPLPFRKMPRTISMK